MKIKLIAIVTLFTASSFLIAAEVPKTFDELDTDHDGYISKSEAQNTKDLSKDWAKADKDKNDKLDVSEFSAFESKGRFVPPEESEEPEIGAAPFEPK